MLTQELYAASLHTARLPCRTIRVCFMTVLLRHFAIVAWVCVDDRPHHTQLARPFDLQASEKPAVLNQRDLALQTHVRLPQLLEVFV